MASNQWHAAEFLSGLIGSLPQMHELAKQAGVKLPSVLGEFDEPKDVAAVAEAKTTSGGEGAAKG